jgi:hypothetical protein
MKLIRDGSESEKETHIQFGGALTGHYYTHIIMDSKDFELASKMGNGRLRRYMQHLSTKGIPEKPVTGRYTEAKYRSAIGALKLGMQQLEPDGRSCLICGDGGHQAWECHHNPLEGLRHYHASRCSHCGYVAFTQEECEEHFGTASDEIAKCLKDKDTTDD